MSLDVDVRGLRVLGFCDYISAAPCGGAERAAVEVYRRLAAAGADVTIVSAVPSQAQIVEHIDDVEVISIRSTELSRVARAQTSFTPRLYGEARRAADRLRPHVLHAHGLYFEGALAAARVQRVTGVPLVTTAHVAGMAALAPLTRMLTSAYERVVGSFILGRSHRMIAVSAAVATHLRTLGVAHDRIDIAENGVDHDLFHPPCPSANGSRPDDAPLVVFVGRLVANKGPDIFVDALITARDAGVRFRAELLGDGPLRGALERTIHRNGLSDCVSIAGVTTDVADHLRRADVFVRPSLTEGMSLAILEAMATGVCIIASDVPANTALVVDGHSGMLFRPGDVGALARRLAWAAENPAARRVLGERARISSLGYSWERATEASAVTLVAAAGAGQLR